MLRGEGVALRSRCALNHGSSWEDVDIEIQKVPYAMIFYVSLCYLVCLKYACIIFLTISSQGNLSQKWVRKSWNELSKGLQEFFFKKNHSRSHENLINRNIVALCIIWLVVKMVFPVISKINMGLVGKMLFPVISKINIGLVVKMLFPVISKINMEPQTMEVWFR